MTDRTPLSPRGLLIGLVLMVALLIAAAIQGNAMAPAVPGPNDQCPVCGMLVAPHPEWLAQVRLADGSTLFFEGPKDMFRYLQAPDSYAKNKRGISVTGGFVTTWGNRKAVPFEDAWFVIGSDVRGPAGEELVPHQDLAHANAFVMEHGGVRVVRGGDMTADVLAKLP